MMTNKLRSISVVMLVVGLVSIGTGCQTAPTNNNGGDGMNTGDGGSGSNNGSQSTAGKSVYDTECIRCHAEPGTGTGNAPDLAGASANLLMSKFNESLHQELFPNFDLQSLNDIAAYLATF